MDEIIDHYSFDQEPDPKDNKKDKMDFDKHIYVGYSYSSPHNNNQVKEPVDYFYLFIDGDPDYIRTIYLN